MKSVMPGGHTFALVPKAEIPRSTFDRSFGHKTTIDLAGQLVPVFVDSMLPGDTANVRMTAFARFATPLKPPMDNMFLESFFFSIPYRLVWDNFTKFMGEQANPGDSTDYRIPQRVSPATTGYAHGGLADHLGIPPGVPDLSHSALFHRAVYLVVNQWFRDENLIPSWPVSTGDGPDSGTDALPFRMKRPDYFTTALPWTQKSPVDITLPLGTKAPVEGIGITSPYSFPNTSPVTDAMHESGAVTANYPFAAAFNSATSPIQLRQDAANPGFPDVYANLQAATSAKINSIRQAFQLQKFFERDARGGTRYKEIIKAHFNVDHPDINYRTEFLGGGSSPINFHPVAQSSGSPVDLGTGYTGTPQGNLSAFGTVTTSGHGFTKSFTEHCIVIGFVNIRADLTYQSGLDKMFSWQTRVDFYDPAFQGLGEQAILNKEIYAVGSGVPGQDDAAFGYQERHGELRYKNSLITGKFRSSDPQSLDYWHLSQDFGSLPTLNATFIEDHPPVERIVAVPSEPHFLFDSFFHYHHARPMPVYGVPGNIDRF